MARYGHHDNAGLSNNNNNFDLKIDEFYIYNLLMDITTIQFMDETFDAVVDKGGLDALMEPQLGPKLGIQYLSEVMRILKSGGKFICLTLAESHVLGTLCSFLLPCFLILVHISIPFSNVSVLTIEGISH